jgi:uncharacterized Fe-S cluster-containing protein
MWATPMVCGTLNWDLLKNAAESATLLASFHQSHCGKSRNVRNFSAAVISTTADLTQQDAFLHGFTRSAEKVDISGRKARFVQNQSWG